MSDQFISLEESICKLWTSQDSWKPIKFKLQKNIIIFSTICPLQFSALTLTLSWAISWLQDLIFIKDNVSA